MGLPKGLDHVQDFADIRGAQAIAASGSVGGSHERSRASEHRKVLRDVRLGDVEIRRDLSNGHRLLSQEANYAETRRVAQRS